MGKVYRNEEPQDWDIPVMEMTVKGHESFVLFLEQAKQMLALLIDVHKRQCIGGVAHPRPHPQLPNLCEWQLMANLAFNNPDLPKDVRVQIPIEVVFNPETGDAYAIKIGLLPKLESLGDDTKDNFKPSNN